uniref:Cytochrome c type-1 n=1 Tax=Ascaris suum TaxID=6253 RepID=F1LGT3_ASCSU
MKTQFRKEIMRMVNEFLNIVVNNVMLSRFNEMYKSRTRFARNYRKKIGHSSGLCLFVGDSTQGLIIWTRETLYDYLKNKRKYSCGTKMFFVGLKMAQDRADVIKYIENWNQ